MGSAIARHAFVLNDQPVAKDPPHKDVSGTSAGTIELAGIDAVRVGAAHCL